MEISKNAKCCSLYVDLNQQIFFFTFYRSYPDSQTVALLIITINIKLSQNWLQDT